VIGMPFQDKLKERGRDIPIPITEIVMRLSQIAGKACSELVEGIPAGLAGESPATHRVAASKLQALGMVENEISWLNMYIGLTGLLDCIFHPGTGVFLGTFFAAVFG
jgi:hypothetical protein